MTKDKEDTFLDMINHIESKRVPHESDICDNLMYLLSALDMGHDRVVRHWKANELYILLTQGKEALKKHRDDEASWWG